MEGSGVQKKIGEKKKHGFLQYCKKHQGGKFREEQRFLLVSIETNSDQEGKGFLSSVRFSEAGSAAQHTGGPG